MANQSADAQRDMTTVTATCHCGGLTASTDVPNTDLPLKLWLCSCNTCRSSSGHIAITCAFLPPSKSPLRVTGNPTKYASSTGPSALVRCFCPTCGAFVYEDSPDPKRQSLYGGAVSGPATADGSSILSLAGITFNGDARDGGLAPFLPGVTAHEENFAPGPDYTPVPRSSSSSSFPSNEAGRDSKPSDVGDKLQCACHCGGVRFQISRPTPASTAFHVPFLEVPFYAEIPPEKEYGMVPNPADDKWWVRGGGDNNNRKDKFAAVLCMCTPCRLASGFDVQPWAFLPSVNLHTDAGATLDIGEGKEGLRSLKGYRSSEGVQRWFCGGCGATVFFTADLRPELVDVSVGLMQAKSGSRAEEWLEWAPRVSYAMDAQNGELREVLEKGLFGAKGGK